MSSSVCLRLRSCPSVFALPCLSCSAVSASFAVSVAFFFAAAFAASSPFPPSSFLAWAVLVPRCPPALSGGPGRFPGGGVLGLPALWRSGGLGLALACGLGWLGGLSGVVACRLQLFLIRMLHPRNVPQLLACTAYWVNCILSRSFAGQMKNHSRRPDRSAWVKAGAGPSPGSRSG